MTFVELTFPPRALGDVDRDDIEDALVDGWSGRLEVTGAGVGYKGSNLDIELGDDIALDAFVTWLRQYLRSVGVDGAVLRFHVEV